MIPDILFIGTESCCLYSSNRWTYVEKIICGSIKGIAIDMRGPTDMPVLWQTDGKKSRSSSNGLSYLLSLSEKGSDMCIRNGSLPYHFLFKVYSMTFFTIFLWQMFFWTWQLRNYEELIQFCEQTIDMAENIQNNAMKLWRWRLMSKSYFYLGKLEEALVFLKKHADAISISDKYY